MTTNCSALGTIRTLNKSKCYLVKLWFNFIFGSNFIFLLFLGVVMYHNEFETKQNKPIDKPRIKLKHNIRSTLALQTPCYNTNIESSDTKSSTESFSSTYIQD